MKLSAWLPHPAANAKLRAVAGAGTVLLNGLLASVRLREYEVENYLQFAREGVPFIHALCHGRLLPCTYAGRGRGLVTLVSNHRDGEYITRLAESWGYTVVRGSSSRGGSGALRQLVRHLREGRSLAITVDGPRGPAGAVKPGTLLAARLSGAPIVPATCAADRAWYARSWDRFMVPKPGSRLAMVYGPPIYVAADADESELAARASDLEDQLRALADQAQSLL